MSSTSLVADLYLEEQRPDEAMVLSKWTPLLELDAVNQVNLACLSCAAGHAQVFVKLLSECHSPSARGHLMAAALRFAPSVWVAEHPFGGANWQRRLQAAWPAWSADLLSVDPAGHSGWDVFLWSCFVGEDDNVTHQRWALNHVARSLEGKPELWENWENGSHEEGGVSKLDVWCWLLAGIPNPDRLEHMLFLLSRGANSNGVMKLQEGGCLSVGSAWIKASTPDAGHFIPCHENKFFASLEPLPSVPSWRRETDISELYEGNEWFECLFGGLNMLMSSGMQVESMQYPGPWPRPLLAQLANAGLDEGNWSILQANMRLPKMAELGLANCFSADQICLLDVFASWTRSQGGWYAGDVDLKELPDTMWDTMPDASWRKLIRSEGFYGFLPSTPAVLNYLMSCVLVQVPFPFDNEDVSRLNRAFAKLPTEEHQTKLERLLLQRVENILSTQEACLLLVRFCLCRNEQGHISLGNNQKALLLSMSHRLLLAKSEIELSISGAEALLLSKCISSMVYLEQRLQSLPDLACILDTEQPIKADEADESDSFLNLFSDPEDLEEEDEKEEAGLTPSVHRIEEVIRRAIHEKANLALKAVSAEDSPIKDTDLDIESTPDPEKMSIDEYGIYMEQQENPDDVRPCHVMYGVKELEDFIAWADEQKDREIVTSWKKKLLPSRYNKESMGKVDFRQYRIKRLALAQPALEAIDDLRRGFPHFEDVIQEISDHMLLASRGDNAFSLPPLLMVGPPGTGKTFFFEELSKRVDTTYEVLNMEGITAGFAIVGLDTGWGGAAPGLIFKTLMRPQTTINPILLLDEIDKVGGNSQHPVGPCLLPLLETHSSQRFEDNCLHLRIDASRINWVATANVIEKIDAPLRSRFNVVPVANPDYYARRAMAGHIYAALRKRNSWGSSFIEKMNEETLQTLARPANAARELRKSITRAFAAAARSQRNELLPQDIPVPEAAPIHYFWDAPLQEAGGQDELQAQE